MDQLPTSLLYYTSAISNFTRNTIKLNTLNTDNLKTDGATQLRLALPTNAICNMKSLSMRCRMITKGQAASGAGGADNNAVYALIPKGGPNAVIDRLTFSSGGQALDNGATPYHVLYALSPTLHLKKLPTAIMDRQKTLLSIISLVFLKCFPNILI